MIATQPKPATHESGAPWTIDDAAAFLRISTRHLRKLCDLNRVKTIAFGRRRMIADSEMERLCREGAGA